MDNTHAHYQKILEQYQSGGQPVADLRTKLVTIAKQAREAAKGTVQRQVKRAAPAAKEEDVLALEDKVRQLEVNLAATQEQLQEAREKGRKVRG